MATVVKRCPECGEMVSVATTKCRYCRHRFLAWTIELWVTVAIVAAVVVAILL